MIRKMKCLSSKLIPALFVATQSIATHAQEPLINGKKITLPPVGVLTQPLSNPIRYNSFIPNLGSHPANLVASPNGKFAVATDLGYREYLSAIDTASGRLVSQLGYGPARVSGTNGLFYGLAFDPKLGTDGAYTLYAAQGNHNTIAVLKLNATTGMLSVVKDGDAPRTIRSTTSHDFPAGLALSADGRYLYVANHQAKTPTDAGSLSIFDTTTSTEVGRFEFTAANGLKSVVTVPGGTASGFPYAISVSQDGTRVYVTASATEYVYVINVATPSAPRLAAEIHTGSHPDGVLVNGNTVYVANAHSDSISVIDAHTDRVIGVIDLRPNGAKSLVGVTPNQMAIAPDRKTLYVALSDMQAVALIDIAARRIKGEIPVGWYPTGIVATGERILVANARGTQLRHPNPQKQDNTATPNGSYHNLNIIEGNVETIALPTPAKLQEYTQQVLANNKITPGAQHASPNPLYAISKAKDGITHVFYIIRENRTYDQVLGDLGIGNGDPTLTLFGKAVTPNIHQLARKYVLLDNFYDIGDASMEGWDWSTAALSNEHIARNQPYNYSGRGASYDSEGEVNGYPVAGAPAGTQGYYTYKNGLATEAENVAPNGVALPPIPDAGGHPNGRIYDTILRAGSTIRNYGALVSNGYPSYAAVQPGGHYEAAMGGFSKAVAGNTDLDFSGFDTSYGESPAPFQIDATLNGGKFLPPHKQFGKYGATNRFDEWNREFQAMLATDPTGGSVPNFELVRFGRDHTAGLNYGGGSAKALVADNDYAVGKFVEVISHSPIWKHSAIFVLEDDSQAGPDHVDGHRSIGFVISPYIKAGTVSSKFYNTTSFLRNMELLLNAAPLTQYDAIADYIDAWDTAPNNSAPYTAILPDASVLSEVLTPGQYETVQEKREYRRMIALAAKMDLVHADAADPAILNEMIWKSVRGITSRMPATRHNGVIDHLVAKKVVQTSGRKAGRNAVKSVPDSDD